MTGENSDKTKQAMDIVTLFIGLASLVFADSSVLRSFFGILLLAVLIRDLRKPSTIWDRFIISMSMSFAAIIACSYYLTSLLNANGWALFEDKILIIGLIGATIFFLLLKSRFECGIVKDKT